MTLLKHPNLLAGKKNPWKKTVKNAVYKMSSTEKKAELINWIINLQSPNSKSEIRKTVTNNAACKIN